MPERIQRKRTKGWRMPPNTVYVGRPSKWGNPFRAGSVMATGIKGPSILAREAAIALFQEWLLNSDDALRLLASVRELRGKDLACWCRLDQLCHADVLLEIANAEKVKGA